MKFSLASTILLASSPIIITTHGWKTNSISTKFQPIFHTPGVGSVGYTGDPNGMFYHSPSDTYHLFWQCSLDIDRAVTPIVWCHAISKDFAKWERLEAQSAMNYSGGATQTRSGDVKMLYKDTAKANAFYTASPEDLTDPRLESWVEDVNASAIGGSTDPSPGWWNADETGFLAVVGANVGANGSATLWSADEEFGNFVNLEKMLLSFPWDRTGKNDSPIPRDPNFFKPQGDSGLWAFEGAMKMCYYAGHDFYALGTYDEVEMDFAYDDDTRMFANDPYDFGGDMFAAETFYAKDGSVVASSWMLEGDCDWNVEEWPPLEHCVETMSRGWAGVHCLPRTVTVETTSPLPGTDVARNSLKFSPIEGIKNLRLSEDGESTELVGGGDGSVEFFDLKSQSFELAVTFKLPTDYTSFEVGAHVLANSDDTEFTRLSVQSAALMENTELTYNLQSQMASALCVDPASVETSADCKAICDADDNCLGWTFIPGVDTATNMCSTLCGVVPLATQTMLACDWGNNLGHDPALSTSGMKGKWLLATIQRGASSSLAGAYGKHDFVGLVRVEEDETQVDLRVFVDVSIVEIFAQDGRSVVTARVYPQSAGGDRSEKIGVFAVVEGGDGSGVDVKATAWEMGPAFEP